MSDQMNPGISVPAEKGISQVAFERLYRDHWKAIFTICYRYVRDSELAADLAQNVFEMAWQKRKILTMGPDIGKYLSRAAKLEAQSHCRNTAHRKELLEASAQPDRVHTNDTEEHVIFRDLNGIVTTFIQQLPDKSQEIYQLHTGGWDKKSIALSLAISEKNVEYHLYKAVNYLRKKMASKKI